MVRELVCAAFLLALATVYYVLASGIGRSALSDEVGPAGLPLAYATLLGGLAIALALKAIVRGVLDRRASTTKPELKIKAGFILARAGGTLAIGAAYVLIVNFLGYWLSLALLLPAMAVYQGQRFDRRLLMVSIVGATVFWALFVWLLGIPMPQPWIRPWAA
jgi:hypothetical protein